MKRSAEPLNQNAVSKKTKSESFYNPYIHGTTSLILSSFDKTQFTLLSPLDMLSKYLCAPISGELRGGLENITTRCNTCFGRMNSDLSYNLDTILSGYTHFQFNENEILERLKQKISSAFVTPLKDLNGVLIYLARAKQIGIDIYHLEPYLNELIIITRFYAQFLYLFPLLGKYFLPGERIENLANKLTPDYLMEKIIEKNIDLKEIYLKPTHSNLNRVVDLLIFENKQLFVLKEKVSSSTLFGNANAADTLLNKFCANIMCNNIQHILHYFHNYEISPQTLKDMGNLISFPLQAIEERINILQNILSATNMKFTAEQTSFLNDPFPLLFIYDKEEKIAPLCDNSSEYRTTEPLQVGRDITMIATDTEEHRLQLMKYFENHKVKNLTIVLFEDLKKSQNTSTFPQSPYVHSDDGFPKLTWLAAKKAYLSDRLNTNETNLEKYRSLARTYYGIKK